MLEKLVLSVEEWAEFVEDDESAPLPVWLRVVSNSMYPWMRANRDEAMLLPVKTGTLRVGDIVLFPVNHANGGYCLHRIHKMEGDRVQTMGDANRSPDGWIPKGDILGKAVVIRRGSITIDCESPKWARRFRWWNRLWRIRPAMLLLFRVIGKCERALSRARAH